MSFSETM